MKFFTSNYKNYSNIDKEKYICIAVSAGVPKELDIPKVTELIPEWAVIFGYRARTISEESYKELYEERTLNKIDTKEKLYRILRKHFSYDQMHQKDLVLLAHKEDNGFCHNLILGEYLTRNLFINEVKELPCHNI